MSIIKKFDRFLFESQEDTDKYLIHIKSYPSNNSEEWGIVLNTMKKINSFIDVILQKDPSLNYDDLCKIIFAMSREPEPQTGQIKRIRNNPDRVKEVIQIVDENQIGESKGLPLKITETYLMFLTSVYARCKNSVSVIDFRELMFLKDFRNLSIDEKKDKMDLLIKFVGFEAFENNDLIKIVDGKKELNKVVYKIKRIFDQLEGPWG